MRGVAALSLLAGCSAAGMPSVAAAREYDVQGARDSVHLLMIRGGDAPPSPTDVAQAILIARELRHAAPDAPAGYAALCEIGRKVHEDAMQVVCANGLERTAPNTEDALRAADAAHATRPSGLVSGAWVILAGLLTAAGAHAAARRWKRRGAAVTLALLGSLPLARSAHAVPSTDHPDRITSWPLDDRDPESTVPTEDARNKNPLEFGYWLDDVTFKGIQASKNGDHPAAAHYFRALARAVPDRAVGFVKLCDEYETMGNLPEAIQACGAALGVSGVKLQDYVHYLHLLLVKPGALTDDEIASMDTVVAHLEGDPDGKLASELACEVAVRLESTRRLEPCVASLEASAPNAPTTILYAWTLAARKNDLVAAARLLSRARDVGLAPDALARMEAYSQLAAARQRRKTLGLSVGVVLVVAAAGFGAFGARRRRVVLASA